jgi:hypothetical protein
LKSDKLCIDEIDLFKGVLRWAVCECKRQNLSDSLENKKKILDDILPLIRFPCMEMQELATFVSPTQLLPAPQLLELFTYVGGKGNKKNLKVNFPTQARGGSRDKWALDDTMKSNTVTLSNGGKSAANSSSNHSYCQGTVAWTKGKHAWRVVRDNGNTQWLLLGVSRKVTHQHNSYNDTTVWGLSSASQRYYANVCTTVNSNFNTGPLDCLFDADAGTMQILNLSNDQRHDLTDLPRGGEGLVPHFGPHSVQSITVYPISVKQFGDKNFNPATKAS